MKRLILCLSAFLFTISLCFGQEVKIGGTLPKWQEGELDIHFISTGRGESTFMIFPDGTTFLTDASGNQTKNYKKGTPGPAEWKPYGDITAGHAIADYVSYFSPEVSKGHINYFLLTCHSAEHVGQLTKEAPAYGYGDFKLTSVCEIGTRLTIDNIFDRDWPDFNYPKENTGGMMTNYRAFLDWTRQNRGTNVEEWSVGSSTQVVPLHDKSCGVTIRNLAGNGRAATGTEGESASYIPSKTELAVMDEESFPGEKCFSCAYILSYGKFDFFNGGDLNYAGSKTKEKYPYKDCETPLLNVLHKVEVMKANNHGLTGSHCAELLEKLAPDVWLVSVLRNSRQPDQGPMDRLLKANPNCDIFCTYTSNQSLGRLVEKLGIEPVKQRIVSRYGHVVVRVANGGDSYTIYTLEDADEEYIIKSVHGPYVCGD